MLTRVLITHVLSMSYNNVNFEVILHLHTSIFIKIIRFISSQEIHIYIRYTKIILTIFNLLLRIVKKKKYYFS